MKMLHKHPGLKRHVIRVSPLKIGNHLLAWLFAKKLSRLIQGPSDIAFAGVSELGVPAENQALLDYDYNFINLNPAYPWPDPEPLGKMISRRLKSAIVSKFTHANIPSSPKKENPCYSRFILSTNTPNLYPIRSASVGANLLLEVQSTVCNIGYLPSRCEAESLIPGDKNHKSMASSLVRSRPHDVLYVHIRAGDILSLQNKLYIPLPVKIIKIAKEKLNVPLVFIGQLQDSRYCQEIRTAFPDDEFLFTDNAGVDFEIIRAARRVLLSTSTFAWLASWISNSKELILIPNVGLFSHVEAPEINLIDASDGRFVYVADHSNFL